MKPDPIPDTQQLRVNRRDVLLSLAMIAVLLTGAELTLGLLSTLLHSWEGIVCITIAIMIAAWGLIGLVRSDRRAAAGMVTSDVYDHQMAMYLRWVLVAAAIVCAGSAGLQISGIL